MSEVFFLILVLFLILFGFVLLVRQSALKEVTKAPPTNRKKETKHVASVCNNRVSGVGNVFNSSCKSYREDDLDYVNKIPKE